MCALLAERHSVAKRIDKWLILKALGGQSNMINNPETAKQISDLMMDIFTRLCDSCQSVKERCSPEEYAAYKKATARIANGIVFDVMEPLYEKNPALKPANWDDAGDLCKSN